MPTADPNLPADDRDFHLGDLVSGRWTVAARLAHRDTGARRAPCTACAGAGERRHHAPLPTEVLSRPVIDTQARVSDLLTGRWTRSRRRTHRAEQAHWVLCLTCRGSGAVSVRA